jgi:four helix bundle protein
MRRASARIPLNFAEGNGKRTPRDRRRFFAIARGSALELAAAFDVAHHLGFIQATRNEDAQDRCDHIAAMLHRYK